MAAAAATGATAAAVAGAVVATQACCAVLLLLLAGRGAAAAALGAVDAPSAGLQRLSEAEWDSYHERDHQGPGTYAFGYDVEDPETGNTQFRQEERHPNGSVTGSYGLVLPDGAVQIVHYTADHLGYRARIEMKRPEGRLRKPQLHPPFLQQPAPQLQAPGLLPVQQYPQLQPPVLHPQLGTRQRPVASQPPPNSVVYAPNLPLPQALPPPLVAPPSRSQQPPPPPEQPRTAFWLPGPAPGQAPPGLPLPLSFANNYV